MEEIDLDEILQEIRERAEQRRRENPEIEREVQRQRLYFQQEGRDPRSQQIEFLLRQLESTQAPERMPSTRFAFLKRAVLRLIRPFTHPQVEFDRALVDLLRQISKEQNNIVELIRTLNDFLHTDASEAARRRLTETYEKASGPGLRHIAARNRRLLEGALEIDFDYLDFEDRFRGSESAIRERLEKYVEFFTANEPVVDLGCGRGEFLELMKEAEIPARGVETHPAMVHRCQEKGLSVRHMDVFEYLKELKQDSIGGVFACQLIEHLEHSEVVALVNLIFSRLKVGGTLVLETINPASLFVHAHSLYLDPTHIRPYHPGAVEFLCRSAGFSRTKLLYSSPVEKEWHLPDLEGQERFNQAVERLNQLLFGPQDYALICVK